MDYDSLISLPPGFRFQPNEDELFYYLKHKVSGEPLDFEPIAVDDVYKSEPWDLPGKSRLKTKDREWYFFSALGRKYGNSSKINRTTEKGYWKTTGRDREVRRNSRTVGMKKKVHVFHTGRAPHGVATNWVMHEYRLNDKELEKAGIAAIGALVLCKIIQKSGTGPKNGEASFGEEGVEHDDMGVVVPGEEAATGEVVVSDQIYIPSENTSLPLKFRYQDNSNDIEYSGVFIEDSQQPIIGIGETSELHHDQKFVDIPEQYGMDTNPSGHEYFAESDDYVNAIDNPPLSNEFYLEAKDFVNPMEVDPVDFDMADLLDMNCDSFKGFDPSEFLGTENTSSHQTPITQKNEIGEADPVSKDSQCLSKLQGSNDASSSKHNPMDFDMADEFLNLDHDLPGMNFDSFEGFDPSELLGTENNISHQTPVTQKNEIGEADQVSKESLCLSKLQGSNDASSSKHNPMALMDESENTFSGNLLVGENACSNT